MELKKGMYVRYRYYNEQKIGKIDFIKQDELLNDDFIGLTNDNGVLEGNILKASDNLIDLIEEGDYVNGYVVLAVTEQYIKLNNPKFNYDVIDYERILKNKYSNMAIKDVVTKEQFENMMHIVESE